MDQHERIKILRKELNMTGEEFSQRLGVTRSAISRIENRYSSLTNQMISSICREFNVSEEWLRNGTGSMFIELTRAEKVARIVGNAINSDNEFIIKTFIALGELSVEEWKLIERIVNKIKED